MGKMSLHNSWNLGFNFETGTICPDYLHPLSYYVFIQLSSFLYWLSSPTNHTTLLGTLLGTRWDWAAYSGCKRRLCPLLSPHLPTLPWHPPPFSLALGPPGGLLATQSWEYSVNKVGWMMHPYSMQWNGTKDTVIQGESCKSVMWCTG